MWARLAINGSKFRTVPRVLYWYRHHGEQSIVRETRAMSDAHRAVQTMLVSHYWGAVMSATEQAALVDWLHSVRDTADATPDGARRTLDMCDVVAARTSRADAHHLGHQFSRVMINHQIVGPGARLRVRDLARVRRSVGVRDFLRLMIRSFSGR